MYNKEVYKVRAIYDSLQKQFKTPTGCAKVGEKVTFRLGIPKWDGPYDVEIIFNEYYSDKTFSVRMNREGEDNESIIFSTEGNFGEKNIYHYYFSFKSYGRTKFVKKNEGTFEGHIQDSPNGLNWQITIYEPVTTNSNMQEGVMYQIFPDRFAKFGEVEHPPDDRIYRIWGGKPFYKDNLISKDFFGGNFQGIIHRLKYLKSLGVTALYLNPIWLAHSNHRYDPADYKTVDPLLGNENDLKELIQKAHQAGMIVIIDTVLNHTGADSIYFNRYGRYPVKGAFNAKDSFFYDWYYFHVYPEMYESWWGFVDHPKINQSSRSFQEYMFGKGGVIDYWYSLGIDGLRLDVPDELPNYALNAIYEVSKRNKEDAVIISEVWEDASYKANYGHRMEYLLGHETTSVMNYPVKNAILAYVRYGDFWAGHLTETLQSIFLENYPREIAWSLMNFVSTHDTVRAITKLAGPEVGENDREWQEKNDTLSRSDYEIGRKRLILSYLILYFLPGIPSIFYGDEVGLQGQKDPFNRKCYPWKRRDKKLLKVFKRLGSFRKREKEFFKNADFAVNYIDNEICILERMTGKRQLYLIINRSDHIVDISMHNTEPERTKIAFKTDKNEDTIHINSLEGMILELF